MTSVNSVSGGKTSAYMAVHHPADVNIFALVCIDYQKAAPKDQAVLKYCLDKLDGNFIASAEREATLKSMMMLEQMIGKEIVWVRGPSFDEVIDAAACLPTWNRRFCTTQMKIIPMFNYLYPRYGKVLMNIGFRLDEQERIQKALEPEKGYMRYPLYSRLWGSNYMKWDTVEWREANFPLRKTIHHDIIKFWKHEHPEFPFPLDSNCAGCHHKGPELINQNYKTDPAILEWFSLQEKKGKGNTWHDDMIPYEKKFNMNFTEMIDFDYPGCNTGFCTD